MNPAPHGYIASLLTVAIVVLVLCHRYRILGINVIKKKRKYTGDNRYFPTALGFEGGDAETRFAQVCSDLV